MTSSIFILKEWKAFQVLGYSKIKNCPCSRSEKNLKDKFRYLKKSDKTNSDIRQTSKGPEGPRNLHTEDSGWRRSGRPRGKKPKPSTIASMFSFLMSLISRTESLSVPEPTRSLDLECFADEPPVPPHNTLEVSEEEDNSEVWSPMETAMMLMNLYRIQTERDGEAPAR